jgi:hypothetical protein
MPPLKVTIRPSRKAPGRHARRAIQERLDEQLKKAAEKEAEGSYLAEYQASRIRERAQKKYFEDWTRIVETKISGAPEEEAMRGKGFGTDYLKRNDGGIARKTRMF